MEPSQDPRAASLQVVFHVTADFIRDTLTLGSFLRTPPSVIDRLVIMEVQALEPRARTSQILYVMDGIRERRSLRPPWLH